MTMFTIFYRWIRHPNTDKHSSTLLSCTNVHHTEEHQELWWPRPGWNASDLPINEIQWL